MSNKTNLQNHNLDLQTILQAIQSQPSSKPWGGVELNCTGNVGYCNTGVHRHPADGQG